MARISRKDIPPALLAQLGESPRRSKYGNTKIVVDGITFDSLRESQRWCELLIMQKAKVIRDLERQKVFPLSVNGKLVCTYKADMVYVDVKTNKVTVEDVKGCRTKDYTIKKKLMEAVYGIEIQET